MEHGRVPYRKIAFVCINRRPEGEDCCAGRQSEAIADALKERVKALGLAGKVRVSKSSCHDVCARGPSVMIFPDYTWYAGVTEDDVERIAQDLARSFESSALA